MPIEVPVTDRRGRLLFGSLMCLTLGLVACSSPSASGPSAGRELPSASPSASASASPAPDAVLAPMTGVATTAAIAARPAVAVPISVGGTRPPSGIGSADIVYAEWDGSAGIRLLALFQSQDNTGVGPVAGLAPSDAKLLPVIKPVLAAGSSYAKFSRQADAAGLNVATVSEHPTAFQQSGGIAYASTAALRALAPAGSRPPQGLFPLAAADDKLAAIGMRPVTRFKVPTAAQPVFSWSWDAASKRWRATVGGAAVSAANVIVLVMGYKSVLAKSPQGPAVPTANIFGTGNAYAVSGPNGAAGRWARNGPLKIHTVATADGVTMRFAPGPTWVILVPDGNAWAVA